MNKAIRQRVMNALGTLADFLEEAHQEDIDNNHYGDYRGSEIPIDYYKNGCSYCVAIQEGRKSIALLKNGRREHEQAR